MSVIDGVANVEEISELFSSKLKDLLNSAIDSHTRSDLLSDVNSLLTHSDLASICISQSVVSTALSHLKMGNSEGTALLSNHFICASTALTEFLSNLFTIMLRHGHMPNCLRDCILQPIPKPGKDPSISDNYRPIVLALTLSKVFEWYILTEYRSAVATSALQFGFKQGLCTGLVKNVIARYCFNDSSVYGCFF